MVLVQFTSLCRCLWCRAFWLLVSSPHHMFYWLKLWFCKHSHLIAHPIRNTCNGPEEYVDHLMKDPNHKNLSKLWIHDCFDLKRKEVMNYTKAIISKQWHDKNFNLNMQWVSTDSLAYHLSFLRSNSSAVFRLAWRATQWIFLNPSRTQFQYIAKTLVTWKLGWTTLLLWWRVLGVLNNHASMQMSACCMIVWLGCRDKFSFLKMLKGCGVTIFC